jgi:hypothetical protein
VCTLLGAHEKYYFGLSFTDKKGDQQWIEVEQKVGQEVFSRCFVGIDRAGCRDAILTAFLFLPTGDETRLP